MTSLASLNAIQAMKIRAKTSAELDFERMSMPHWTNYLSPYDAEEIRKIVNSKRLSGNLSEKMRRIKEIMYSRGFVRLAGGTNRTVFRHLEDTRFVAKVAIDSVGMGDNPAEFEKQWLIQPFCTKMFQITDCGTIGFAERVVPITHKEEFRTCADDVFDLLYNKILGKYIIEDVGTKFFMNYGIRPGFGPVLLDYPYIYDLMDADVICHNSLPNGLECGGEIDYDDGINFLICKRCGRKHIAMEMKKNETKNKFIINKGGKIPMNVSIIKGNQVIAKNNSCNFIVKPSGRSKELEEAVKNSKLGAMIVKNGKPFVPGTSHESKEENMASEMRAAMSDIMAQIKENTKLEQAKNTTVEVKEEEVKVDVLTIAESAPDTEKEETMDISEDTSVPTEETPDSSENKKENVSIDPTNADEKAGTDEKGRTVIGKRKFSIGSKFIPDGVESEY